MYGHAPQLLLPRLPPSAETRDSSNGLSLYQFDHGSAYARAEPSSPADRWSAAPESPCRPNMYRAPLHQYRAAIQAHAKVPGIQMRRRPAHHHRSTRVVSCQSDPSPAISVRCRYPRQREQTCHRDGIETNLPTVHMHGPPLRYRSV